MELKVRCGTYHPEEFSVDLDRYSNKAPRNLNVTDEKAAIDLLFDTMNDDTFADDHCRNEDAVNGCIALHVLGYDAEVWFENFCAEQGRIRTRWLQYDLDTFMTHVERVSKYLDYWGPEGCEEKALAYAIIH